MTDTDGGLHAQAKADVFIQMFEAHYARVVRYAEGQLSGLAAAEDVASDVFRVAWLKLDPREPFGLPWLIRTAMHKSRDVQRSRYRGKAAVEALGERATSTVGDHMSSLDRLSLLEALSKLSGRDRQILHLTYWVDLSAGEVAEVLRIRPGAVWTRLHRARERLRAVLDTDDEMEARR